ncbi:junctional sarcoplasmic reticulum protein 1 isoform X1 [Protobothrops mucrosquamatus]|uniref:junctional sarcoplasmic reticulum protein 1 isoform X1 n=2 Tax=Protobothrops mucrosquamatus TaxID=103944 RepID=UPI0007757F06|nr:junctional sarcoplasmic reticulum protein 1 isoform X1 [Protobothrops mucrosquamatus]
MLSQQQPLKSPTSAPWELPLAGLCKKLKYSNEGGKPEYRGGDMATGPSEQLEQSEEQPDFVKELLTQKEGIQNHLKEDNKKDAKIPASQEEVNGSTNGLEEEQKNKLHVVEKDLDEFVDSLTEVPTSGLPKKPPDEEKHLVTEMAAAKLPRAEQVAEKVLRAERVVERAQRVEKPPVLEKVAEKVPRVEKAHQVEKAVRAEKTAEKSHLAALKIVSVKRKTESRAAKDTLPWEPLTLNKCILVATFLALLSVSCQVVQEAIEYGGAVLEAELNAWTTQEDSPGEQEELWFYERWFDWSDMDEPPEIEEEEFLEVEEELLEVEEEEKEAPLEDGEEGTEPVEIKEEEEEEEETEEESLPKRGLRKMQEKIKRETPSKSKSQKDRKVQEKEEEKKHLPDRRHHWEGKGKEKQQEDRKTHRHKHGDTAPPLKEHKEKHPLLDKRRGSSKDEHGKGKGHLKHEKDPKDRKPWQIQKNFFPSPKESTQRFGRHKSQELKRHD